MKKALFINPPIYDFALYDLFLKPLGLLRCAEWLRKSGWLVSYINALDYNDTYTESLLGPAKRKSNGTGKFYRKPIDISFEKNISRKYARYGIEEKRFKSLIKDQEKPDVVFVTSGMTYWYSGVKETIENVKEIFPDSPVITGGPYSTLLEKHCLEVCGADYVLKGDVWPDVKKIFSKLNLPCPERGPGIEVLMDEKTWKDAAVLKLNSGCPMSCNYCASSKVSGLFKPGDPDEVYKVFSDFRNMFSTENFAFYDDALLVNKEKVLIPFLKKVVLDNIKVNFYLPNAVHVKYIDAPSAELLVEAGFREIRLGFESSSKRFHDKMDKKYAADDFIKKIEILKKAGFKSSDIAVYILSGLPAQKAEDVAVSIDYARKFGVKIYLAEYSPVPGTVLWQESKKLSSLPLADDPVYHNNTFFPMEWDGFKLKDLKGLKLDIKKYNESIF